MSLDSNPNSALLKLKEQREAKKLASEGQSTPPAAALPTDGTGQNSSQNIALTPPVSAPLPASPAQPPVEAVPQAGSPTDLQKEEPKPATPPTEVKKDTPAEEKPIEDPEFKWDADIPVEEPLSSSETIDFKKIGSALNLEVKNESELIQTVNEKLARIKELEASANLVGVPEPLKQAIEIAKKGGDWLSYAGVTAVDPSKIDPVELFEHEYERTELQRFKNPDGSINYEKFDEELDSIPVGVKTMNGNQLKQQIMVNQQQRSAQIMAQAVQLQETFQKNLGDTVKELSTMFPKETFGIALEPKHSAFFYEGIAKGTLIKKHLGDIDPSLLAKLDPKKLMKTIVLSELGEKISQFRYKQGEVAAKKALLNSTQNPQLIQPSSPPVPEPKVEDKPITSADRLRNMQTLQKPPGSL